MYTIHYPCLADTVVLPKSAVQALLGSCEPDTARALLYIFASSCKTVSAQELSRELGLSPTAAEAALRHWATQGVLCPCTAPSTISQAAPPAPARAPVVATTARLSQKEVNEIAATSEEVQFLLSEIQNAFGRPISPTEVSAIVSLYRLHCLPVAVIIMLTRWCVSIGKAGFGYIQKVGAEWAATGIDTVEKADLQIQKLGRSRQIENQIKQHFGIHDRILTEKERNLCYIWVEEYGFDLEVIACAYEIAVNRTGKLSFAYIGSILKAWHQKGLHTVAQAKAEGSRKKASSAATQSSFSAADLDRDWQRRTLPQKEK